MFSLEKIGLKLSCHRNTSSYEDWRFISYKLWRCSLSLTVQSGHRLTGIVPDTDARDSGLAQALPVTKTYLCRSVTFFPRPLGSSPLQRRSQTQNLRDSFWCTTSQWLGRKKRSLVTWNSHPDTLRDAEHLSPHNSLNPQPGHRMRGAVEVPRPRPRSFRTT